MTLLRKKVSQTLCCVAFIAILLGGLQFNSFKGVNTAYAADSTIEKSGFSSDQLEALKFLNEVRSKVGVPPVSLNAAITKAAISHASYYNQNKADHPGLKAHEETSGNSGFTGKTIIDRIKAAGWKPSKYGWGCGEVMAFSQKSSSEAVQAWLDTAYHREIILDPSLVEVGIGLVDGTAVVDLAGPGTTGSINGGISLYPYDQQTGVPVGFYGYEIPNPLVQFGVEFSGSIISAFTEEKMTSHQAVITNENGVVVPYNEELQNGERLFLYPKSILQGYHKYTVTLNYQLEGSSENKNKIWSFTTGEGHKLTNLLPIYNDIVLNEGGGFQLQIKGEFDDYTTDELSVPLKFSINRSNGLSVSSNGVVKGIKSGEYVITAAVSDGHSTKIRVKVYPKWKTKAYPGADPNSITDISGQKNKSAIEWAVKNGIISASASGQFNPEAVVSEAEFWTMLLKAYSINIDAYRTNTKIKHWADTAYLIAKDRNYPLDGLTNIAVRDKGISRSKVAEIITAADGVNVQSYHNEEYVLARDYVRGVTELSIDGYQGNKLLTRVEAAQILQHLTQKLSELRGRPINVTPAVALPPLPEKEVYIKPEKIEEGMIFAEFHEDYKLIVEGKFSKFSGQSLELRVQTGGKNPKAIQDIPVSLDSQGYFKVEVGPFQQESLNLYLNTPGLTYCMAVVHSKMNLSKFSR